MKKVKFTTDENVAERTRTQAVENQSSVSRYDIAMKKFMSKSPINLKPQGKYPKREDLYDC